MNTAAANSGKRRGFLWRRECRWDRMWPASARTDCNVKAFAFPLGHGRLGALTEGTRKGGATFCQAAVSANALVPSGSPDHATTLVDHAVRIPPASFPGHRRPVAL